jgi:hypothetical protein
MEKRQKKRAIVIGIELFIALIFFIGADWAGQSAHRLFHSYFADIALPFGFYFLLIVNEDSFLFLRPWHNKALAVFLLVSTSEVLQYFGIYALASVFDPIDFLMYASGVLLAALADTKLISKYYPALHTTDRF